MINLLKTIYIRTTGYSYTNMGRLFLRLFVGVMLLQFGLRQIYHFDDALAQFPSTLGMTPETSLIVMIIVELVCSIFIMFGFCTRMMTVPPFVAMILAEHHLLTASQLPSYEFSWMQAGYLPVMFMGIFFFIMLVGPGKISVDYFLSLHFIHTNNRSEAELEEV